jgi:hypothetical protein
MLKEKDKILLIGLLLLFVGCSTPREAVMPFRNMVYTSEKIFPIQDSEVEWVFRVWFNNGTSIDRIITVSKDSFWGNESYILELGTLYRKGLFGREKKERINNLIKENPKNGFDSFIQVIDSLDLENYQSQVDFAVIADHNPFSLYIVEFKKGDKYHQFRFNTYFPMSLQSENMTVEEKYEFIQKLLFDEFGYRFYMK